MGGEYISSADNKTADLLGNKATERNGITDVPVKVFLHTDFVKACTADIMYIKIKMCAADNPNFLTYLIFLLFYAIIISLIIFVIIKAETWKLKINTDKTKLNNVYIIIMRFINERG